MEDIKVVIGIEIRGEKLLLSEEEAKALYGKLHQLFKDKKVEFVPYNVPIVCPTYPVVPFPYYKTPKFNPYDWPNITVTSYTTSGTEPLPH